MMSSSVPKSLISKLNKRSQLKSEKAKGAWWNTQDVHFSCSGCGKCCLNEGSVWLNVDECADLCFHLDEPIQSVADKYFSDYMPGWAKLKNVQVQSKDEGVTDLIFLMATVLLFRLAKAKVVRSTNEKSFSCGR